MILYNLKVILKEITSLSTKWFTGFYC